MMATCRMGRVGVAELKLDDSGVGGAYFTSASCNRDLM